MPETPIDKDSDLRMREYEVRLSRQRACCPETIAQTLAPQGSTQQELDIGSRLPHELHTGTSLFGG
jgi:hypothetical protein